MWAPSNSKSTPPGPAVTSDASSAAPSRAKSQEISGTSASMWASEPTEALPLDRKANPTCPVGTQSLPLPLATQKQSQPPSRCPATPIHSSQGAFSSSFQVNSTPISSTPGTSSVISPYRPPKRCVRELYAFLDLTVLSAARRRKAQTGAPLQSPRLHLLLLYRTIRSLRPRPHRRARTPFVSVGYGRVCMP